MPTLEIWDSRGRDYFTLSAPACIVGSSEDADLVLNDPTVSGAHLQLELVGTVWLVQDLGSRNGTRRNGRRLVGQERVRHQDEIVLGRTRLVFLDGASERRPTTMAIDDVPELTRSEHRVLVELCRPLLSGNPFTPPASVLEVAARLYVGKGAIQAHLGRMYDKFGIGEDVHNRRVVLANEAVQRGAVTRRDLEAEP